MTIALSPRCHICRTASVSHGIDVCNKCRDEAYRQMLAIGIKQQAATRQSTQQAASMQQPRPVGVLDQTPRPVGVLDHTVSSSPTASGLSDEALEIIAWHEKQLAEEQRRSRVTVQRLSGLEEAFTRWLARHSEEITDTQKRVARLECQMLGVQAARTGSPRAEIEPWDADLDPDEP